MVDFTLPEVLSDEFVTLLPYQRVVAQRFFSEGRLLNYAFSSDNGKLWAVFTAGSEMEVMEILQDFPLTKFMDYEISLLSTYNFNRVAPNFSLN